MNVLSYFWSLETRTKGGTGGNAGNGARTGPLSSRDRAFRFPQSPNKPEKDWVQCNVEQGDMFTNVRDTNVMTPLGHKNGCRQGPAPTRDRVSTITRRITIKLELTYFNLDNFCSSKTQGISTPHLIVTSFFCLSEGRQWELAPVAFCSKKVETETQ